MKRSTHETLPLPWAAQAACQGTEPLLHHRTATFSVHVLSAGIRITHAALQCDHSILTNSRQGPCPNLQIAERLSTEPLTTRKAHRGIRFSNTLLSTIQRHASSFSNRNLFSAIHLPFMMDRSTRKPIPGHGSRHDCHCPAIRHGRPECEGSGGNVYTEPKETSCISEG